MAESKIAAELVAAYVRARYIVADGETKFRLLLDTPSFELLTLYRRHSIAAAAFITACNPQSAAMPSEQNKAAQVKLLAETRALGYLALSGFGEDPSGMWQPEESYLVLGIPELEARALGRKYGQNALLIAAADAIPRLALLGNLSLGPCTTKLPRFGF